MTLDEMAAEIACLAKEFDRKFMPLARMLSQYLEALLAEVLTGSLGLFYKCCKKAGIGRRKAFYLAFIDRVYGSLELPMQRLTDIGWSKLAIMAPYVDPHSIEHWLGLAEKHTAEELHAIVSGKASAFNKVVLKFSDADYGVFAGGLLVNGAYLVTGGGLAHKEKAVLNLINFQRKAWAAAFY